MIKTLTLAAASAAFIISAFTVDALAQKSRPTIFSHKTGATILGTVAAKTTAASYTVQATSAPYVELSSGISLNGTEVWDDPEAYKVPMAFDFYYFDHKVDTFFVDGMGGFLTTGEFYSGMNTDTIDLFIATMSDLHDRSNFDMNPVPQSPITYAVEGVVPGRILKIQWKNAGFYDDDILGNMYTNFQVWFYEGSNNIEIHYGTSNVSDLALAYDGGTGPSTILANRYIPWTDSLVGTAYGVTGMANNPSLVQFNLVASNPPMLTDTPVNGMVQRFIYNNTTSVSNVPKLPVVSVSPNPVTDVLNVRMDGNPEGTLTIMDITGKTVINRSLKNRHSLNIAALTHGIYILKIASNGFAPFTQRIIKL